jgi:integrase
MAIFLTVEQIHALLDIARRTSPRDYAILKLMANTGLRESDVLGLKKQHVLTKAGEIVKSLAIKTKKTGKIIDKILTDSTREAIAAHLCIAPRSEWLFPGELVRHPLSRRTMHRIFKRHLAKLMGEGVSLRGSSTHTLRRSVSFAISQKQGLESASIFLGHSSLANTIYYLDRYKLQERADEAIMDMNL